MRWSNLQFDGEQGKTKSDRSDVGSTESTTLEREHEDGDGELSGDMSASMYHNRGPSPDIP